MEMVVQFDPIQMRRLQKNLAKMPGATGITEQWLVWDTARLAANDAIKFTAPWASGSPGTGSAQKRQGETAASSDLDRAFARQDERFVFFVNPGTSERMARNVATGRVFSIPAELWEPDVKDRHESLRNRRGRVLRQKRQAWVKPKVLDKYVKSVQARVGELKASWLPAARHFAGLVSGKVAASAWITRHAGAGTYINTLNKSGNGTVILSNTAAHNTAIRRDMINFIQKQRQKFLGNVSKKRMEQIAAQFNRNAEPQAIRVAA